MAVIPLLAMVRKDLQLFFSDRRSVIVSFVVPIAIASFFGAVFSGGGQNREPARIAVAIVDQDGSAISKAIVAGAETDKNLKVAKPTADEAREAVKKGSTAVAVVIPKGFGDAAGQAFFGDGEKPVLTLLYDPSHRHRAGDGARRHDAARDGGGEPGDVRRRSGPAAGRADAAADPVVADDAGRIRSGCWSTCSARCRSSTRTSRPARCAGARRAARAHDAVHRQRGSDDRRLEHRLQRLRALVRRDGDSVPAVRDGEHRRRDAARAAARAVEPAAQRADLEGDAARRQGGQRHADLADDPARLVRLRDGGVRRPHPGQRRSGSSASRSPAR